MPVRSGPYVTCDLFGYLQVSEPCYLLILANQAWRCGKDELTQEELFSLGPSLVNPVFVHGHFIFIGISEGNMQLQLQ